MQYKFTINQTLQKQTQRAVNEIQFKFTIKDDIRKTNRK